MQPCIVALWALACARRANESADGEAEAAATAIAEFVAACGELRLAVVGGVLATDGSVLRADALVAAHGLAALWRDAQVAEVRIGAQCSKAELIALVDAMLRASDGEPAGEPLAALGGVAVTRLDAVVDDGQPVRAVERSPRGGAGPDSALRSVWLQHRLIDGLPSLPGIAPTTAKTVVQMVVERLLALPGGLEPLMLLQQDAALLQNGIRVAVLTVLAARAGGWPDDRLADLGGAALLHDIGSILDDARPGPAGFAWLLERGADDFWLRCALVARRWRDAHGALDDIGNGGLAAPALVRLAVAVVAELRAGCGDLAVRLRDNARGGAFPVELVDTVPSGLFAASVG